MTHGNRTQPKLVTGHINRSGQVIIMNITDILNAPWVNTLLKTALSRVGICSQIIIAWVMGHVMIGKIAEIAHQYATDAQLVSFSTWASTALTTALTTFIGWFMWWIQHRQKDGVRAMQKAFNASDAPVNVKVDGIAGNATVSAASKVSEVPLQAMAPHPVSVSPGSASY